MALAHVVIGSLPLSGTVLSGDESLVDSNGKISNQSLAFSTSLSGVSELDDNAPVEDIISKVNAMIRALKAPLLAIGLVVTSMLSYGNSLAPDDPEGIKFKQIPGSTSIYTKAQVDYILKNIDGAEKNYAMLVIPLNRTDSEDFVNFELKASTNNFIASVSTNEWDKWTFWSIGSTADNTAVQRILRNDGMLLYHENGVGTDIRSYTYATNTILVEGRVSSWVVIVDPSRCFTHLPAKDWLKSSNDELIWTYVRVYRSGDYEKDDQGRYLWNPIVPAKWFKELPAWATTNIMSSAQP